MTAVNLKKYGKVAVLMGGSSGEREISLKSGTAVLKALLSKGIDAHGIDVDKNIFSVLREDKFDRVFIALHGCGGEDGAMQGGLEMLELPYTGSGVMASSICMNKLMTKKLWETADVQSPKFMQIDEAIDYQQIVSLLSIPFVIKPSLEGSSLGIHKISSEEEFLLAKKDAYKYQGALMAEQWIDGEEYTVAVLNGVALPVIKLETPHEFYDYDAKYQASDTQYILPCGLPEIEENVLKSEALNAFNATSATGWGRVDVMLDKNKERWFLEVNTVPGMTDHSLVPMAAASVGINFEQLVLNILDTTFQQSDN
ncbi:MAG: D-alanine--D-alanine ligase [Gammaproteobacteria bacterium]|nr:D-alanine--D-alanine ligase [Gammaproteobacteria bacterium]